MCSHSCLLVYRDHLCVSGRRRMVLSVLPGGKATLIVRVLEAFIALQYQAGVLTEEVVLAVQLLVEVRLVTWHMDVTQIAVRGLCPACPGHRLPVFSAPFIGPCWSHCTNRYGA